MYALSQQATESSCLSVSHWNKQQHTCVQAKCKFPTMDISAFVGNHFLMTRYKWPPAEQQGPTVVHFDGWTASRENVIPKFVRWELRVCTYVRMYVWSTYSTFTSQPPTYATRQWLWSLLSGQTTLVLWTLGLGTVAMHARGMMAGKAVHACMRGSSS